MLLEYVAFMVCALIKGWSSMQCKVTFTFVVKYFINALIHVYPYDKYAQVM